MSYLKPRRKRSWVAKQSAPQKTGHACLRSLVTKFPKMPLISNGHSRMIPPRNRCLWVRMSSCSMQLPLEWQASATLEFTRLANNQQNKTFTTSELLSLKNTILLSVWSHSLLTNQITYWSPWDLFARLPILEMLCSTRTTKTSTRTNKNKISVKRSLALKSLSETIWKEVAFRWITLLLT